MGEYINYWLKKLMKKTPKSSKLIDKVRKMSLEIDEDKKERDGEWLVEQYNRNRDQKDWISNTKEI